MRWVTEFLWLVWYIISSFLDYLYFPKIHHGKKKIVLLNGWMSRRFSMYILKSRLEKEGYEVHVPNLGWNVMSIQRSARKLSEYNQVHNIYKPILIGHSLGGLVASYYAQSNRTEKVIALGTPFAGSSFAKLSLTPGLSECKANSKFLKSLKLPQNLISIHSKNDEFVSPSSSIVGGAVCIESPDVGHASLIYSNISFGIILKNI